MRKHLLIVTASLLAFSAPAAATDDSQLWTTASANVKLSDRWRLSQEVVARFSDNRNGLYEIESNSLLGYKLGKVTTIWGGYTHNPQYSDGDFSVMEHRFREQITFDNFTDVGPGKLSARLRFEQRWRDGVDGTAVRTRPYIRLQIPLKKGSKTALNLSNETFVNLNTTPFQKTSGLDRMRNAIAITTPLGKTLNLEAGYLNQHGFVRGGEDTSDHAATISLSLSL
jgi:hypothetical protein